MFINNLDNILCILVSTEYGTVGTAVSDLSGYVTFDFEFPSDEFRPLTDTLTLYTIISGVSSVVLSEQIQLEPYVAADTPRYILSASTVTTESSSSRQINIEATISEYASADGLYSIFIDSACLSSSITQEPVTSFLVENGSGSVSINNYELGLSVLEDLEYSSELHYFLTLRQELSGEILAWFDYTTTGRLGPIIPNQLGPLEPGRAFFGGKTKLKGKVKV